MNKVIIFSFLFFLSFSSAFALTEHLRLYVVFSFALVFYAIFKVIYLGYMPKINASTNVTAISSMCFVLYLWFISIFLLGSNTLIYLIVYTFFYVVLLYAFAILIKIYGVLIFLKFNALSVLLISFFVILDFVLIYYFVFDVQGYIPRIGPVPDATVLGVFRRAYGFSNEPTNLSAYLLAMGGVAVYYWITFKIRFTLYYTILVLMALFLTFSGSALGGLVIALIAVCLIYFFLMPLIFNKKIFSLFCLIFLIVVAASFSDAVHDVASKFFVPGDGFGSGRGANWEYFWELSVSNNFLPNGLGSSGVTGIFPINTYLMILFEGGVIGLVLKLNFVFFPLLMLVMSKLPHFDKAFLLIVYIACFAQLGAFDTFYYPYAILLVVFTLSFLEPAWLDKVSRKQVRTPESLPVNN